MTKLEELVIAKYEAATINSTSRQIYENLLKEAGLLVESDEITIKGTTSSYRTDGSIDYNVSFKARKNARFVVLGIHADGTTEVVRQSESYKAASDASYKIGADYSCPFVQVVMHEIRKPLIAA